MSLQPDDVTLDNARQEIEFYIKQMVGMEPSAKAVQNLTIATGQKIVYSD